MIGRDTLDRILRLIGRPEWQTEWSLEDSGRPEPLAKESVPTPSHFGILQDEVEQWKAKGYSISLGEYVGDGLWYAIAKHGPEDIGIRCKNIRGSVALAGVLSRVRDSVASGNTGKLFMRA